MGTIKRIKIAKLKLDERFYPRDHVDEKTVHQMVEALEAGAKFPPIVISLKTNIVIDGFHRVTAYLKKWGDTAVIEAECREYETEADMFADAVRLNANHGRAFSNYDRATAIAKAESFGIERFVVASILQITQITADKLAQRRFATFGQQTYVLKETASHLAGKILSEDDVTYNRKAGGLNQSFYINQVLAMIELGTINWDSEKQVESLRKLHRLLGEALKVVV